MVVGDAIQGDMTGTGGRGKEWSSTSPKSNALFLLQSQNLISSKPSWGIEVVSLSAAGTPDELCCLFSHNSCFQLGPSVNSICLERQDTAAAA